MRQVKITLLLFNLYHNILNELCDSLSSVPKGKLPFKAKWIDLLLSKSSSSSSLQQITPPRSGHVSFTIESLYSSSPERMDEVYIFGGYAEEENNGKVHRYASNDLWKLCRSGWIQVTQRGDIPNVRLASASAVVDNNVLLFGGWDPEIPGTGGVILDTTHVLDVITNTWKHLSDAVIPDGPTSRHVAISLPDKERVLIHNHRCIDHVLIYNNIHKEILKQPVSGDDDNDMPSSRGLHSACMLNDEKTIVFFGGAAQNGEMSNEVFLLNIDSWKWKKIALYNRNCPSPRASPCICVLNDDNLIVYGGAEYITASDGSKTLYGHGDVWLLRITNKEKGLGEWELLIPEDDGITDDNIIIPPGRNAATLSRIRHHMISNMLQEDYDEDAFYFILHGGWKPFQKTFNDMFVLKVTK